METQTSVTRPEVREPYNRVPHQSQDPSVDARLETPIVLKPARRRRSADLQSRKGSESPGIEVRSRKPWKASGKDVRSNYRLFMQFGFVIALSALIALAEAPIQYEAEFEVPIIAQEIVQLEEIQQTKQKQEAPPPRRPPVPIEVPNDEVIEDEALELDAALDLDEMILDLGPPDVPVPEEAEEEVENEIFVVVEEMPSIIGGTARLYELVEYPVMATKAGLEGTVVVGMVIQPDGVPSELFIMKSVHEILDAAALEAIRQVRFTPGRQRGRAVHVRMAIPIRFKLR